MTKKVQMMANDGFYQRMLPMFTAVFVSMVTAVVVVALLVFERERDASVADREIVEAAQVLHSVTRRFDELLSLQQSIDTLKMDTSRLREQINFLREKNEFLELQIKAAVEQGLKLELNE